MTQTDDAYLKLRQTPLHIVEGAERQQFCTETATWLANPDPWIRSDATERLATAVFCDYRAEPSDRLQSLSWLLDTVLAASRAHGDVLSAFMRQLRYQVPSREQLPPLLIWLDQLEQSPPVALDPSLPASARLVLSPREHDWPAKAAKLVVLLDHSSALLRGTAALVLGEQAEEDGPFNRQELMTLVGPRELLRPGIAGPFWSSYHLSGDWQDLEWPVDPILWMMDLLERRQQPVPTLKDMPSNDIEFYLHELCCFMPEMVDRMLANGFLDLAIETATEMHSPVDGMEPRLRLLATHENPEIATRAARHLEHHYQ